MEARATAENFMMEVMVCINDGLVLQTREMEVTG